MDKITVVSHLESGCGISSKPVVNMLEPTEFRWETGSYAKSAIFQGFDRRMRRLLSWYNRNTSARDREDDELWQWHEHDRLYPSRAESPSTTEYDVTEKAFEKLCEQDGQGLL